MPKLGQTGVAHIALIILLLAVIILVVFLVSQRTKILPHAQEANQIDEQENTDEEEASLPYYRVGDVNGDGKLTEEDIVELKKYLDLDIASIQKADADGDGKITLNDYNILTEWVKNGYPGPSCKPRPACLDANPACYIVQSEDMCPPATKCTDNSQCSANQVCDFNSPDCPRNERYCPPGGDCPQPLCYGKCTEKSTKSTPTPISFTCGGIQGTSCPEGYTCIYPTPNYPDAAGKCTLSPKSTPTTSACPGAVQLCPVGYELQSNVRCDSSSCPEFVCVPISTDNPPATPTPTNSPPPGLLVFKEGDVNGDGSVNFRDALEIFGNLGKNECGNKYDVNKDCRVNTRDIQLIIQNYGR